MMRNYLYPGRFHGCLVGAVVGDCLGAPFESNSNIPESALRPYIWSLGSSHVGKKKSINHYTDDTAMTFALCKSLLKNNGVNIPDLAHQFASDFMNEPTRGYGAGAQSILSTIAREKLYESSRESEIFAPARLQFNGTGSYGNGAAMRVSPLALFHILHPIEQMIDSVRRQALITHSNGLAVLGAIVQAAAVRIALQTEDSKEIKPKHFINELKNLIIKVEGFEAEHREIYNEKFDHVLKLLTRTSIDVKEICDKLGNDISAPGSIPTAVYAFLRALDSARPDTHGLEISGTLRTIYIALRIGGDTDTIASMAGAIAGAYYGRKDFSDDLLSCCEGVQTAESFADSIYDHL